MCDYDDFGGYADLGSYNGDPVHDMEVDYSYHVHTGELSDLFDDDLDIDDWNLDSDDFDEDDEEEEEAEEEEMDEDEDLDEEDDDIDIEIPYSGFVLDDPE